MGFPVLCFLRPTSPFNIERVYQAGTNLFVIKPIQEGKMLEIIEKILLQHWTNFASQLTKKYSL